MEVDKVEYINSIDILKGIKIKLVIKCYINIWKNY